MGAGDYTSLYTYTGEPVEFYKNNEVNSDGQPLMTYNLTSAGFGLYNATSGDSYFTELGYAGYDKGVIIAFDFQGLGLPTYMHDQMMTLLYQIDATYNTALTCTDANCKLASTCKDYPLLWERQFSI